MSSSESLTRGLVMIRIEVAHSMRGLFGDGKLG